MAVGEMLVALRRELEEVHGVEAAAYLMDRPQGGWDSLVTKDELRTQVAELRLELHKELRAQTWQLAKLVAGAQGIVVVAIAAIGAMLRFA
jgi:hypothetical protein